MLCNIADGRIGYKPDFLDVFVMISHKAEMRHHRSEIFPSGECWCLNNETSEIAGSFDIWVNRFGELDKIICFERRFWSYIENCICSIESVINHAFVAFFMENGIAAQYAKRYLCANRCRNDHPPREDAQYVKNATIAIALAKDVSQIHGGGSHSNRQANCDTSCIG